MRRARRRLPAAFLLALFLGLLLAPVGAVFAEDVAPAKPSIEADAASDEVLTEADLTKLFLEKPKALWALGLLKIVPMVVGLALLIAAWIQRRERTRGGLLASPAATRLTLPFELGGAFAVWIGGFVLVPGIIVAVYQMRVSATVPLWVQILAMGLGTVAAAVLVVLRRQRLALQAADQGASALGATPPPSLGPALAKGLAALCIALLIITPLAVGWALFIEGVTGEKPPLQGLVQLALDPTSTYEPWLIAAFGVFVAPFAEEAIFRGMLYPALRAALVKTVGLEARATWISAVAISVLFAAIHRSWLAAVPLFVLAMVLTWLFQRTNSLAACVAAHAAHNAFAMIPILLLRLP